MKFPVPTGARPALTLFVHLDSGGIVGRVRLVSLFRPRARLRLTPLEVFPQGGLQARLARGRGSRLWLISHEQGVTPGADEGNRAGPLAAP